MLSKTNRAVVCFCWGLLAIAAILLGDSGAVFAEEGPPTISEIVNEVVDVPGFISDAITVMGGVVAVAAAGFAGFKVVKLGLRWLGWIRG